MIDVHVLTYSGTRKDWLDQCLASLAREPLVTVHVLDGDEGNVGAGRVRGYQMGTHQYVSYVDSDDYILPGTIEACIEGLQSARHVVTLERRLRGDTWFPGTFGNHHLVVYTRADVLPVLDVLPEHPMFCDKVLADRLTPRQLAHVGYVWRQHADQGHRKATFAELQKAEEAWSR